MSQETLIYVMTAAVGVSAAAIVIQLILLFGMFFSVRETKKKFLELSERVEPLIDTSRSVLDSSRILLDQTRKQIGEITAKTNQLLSTAQTQMNRVDEFLGDAAARSKAQLEHAELVVDDALNRVQETSAMLQTGVLKPLRQINGLAVGIQAAIEFLVNRRRTTPEHATQEDEMFI
jgi:hypothetical protein